MTKIYLWVKDEGWKEFELHSDECKAQLKENHIIIGTSAIIGDFAKIWNSAKIGDFAIIGTSAKILKTLFITGTKHPINWWGTGIINIGCHKNTIEYWLENYYRIGKLEGYSEIEIEEYKSYILFCEQLQKSMK